jgi:hypothetical protein
VTVHDLPDYTREMIIKFTGGFIGLEELAYRLKSIVPWDLQGNVIFLEDFESEVTEWDLVVVGTLSSAARSSERKWSGDWSLKLVADDEVDATAYATRQFGVPDKTKLGIFTRLGFLNNQKEIIIECGVSQDNAQYQPALLYRGEANELYYRDDTDTFQLLASDVSLGLTEILWWPFLLVVDLETGKYVKAVVNNTTYDLSDKAMYDAGAGVPFYGSVAVRANAVGAFGTTTYVDDIIVVKNVP